MGSKSKEDEKSEAILAEINSDAPTEKNPTKQKASRALQSCRS